MAVIILAGLAPNKANDETTEDFNLAGEPSIHMDLLYTCTIIKQIHRHVHCTSIILTLSSVFYPACMLKGKWSACPSVVVVVHTKMARHLILGCPVSGQYAKCGEELTLLFLLLPD